MRVLFWLILALLTLVQFRYVGESTSFNFDGTMLAWMAGVLLAVGLAVLLFNRVQALLLVRGLIDQKVRTPYDVFPLLLLVPFVISFTLGDPSAAAGDESGWFFRWGGPVRAAFIFLGMLGLLYVYRIVVLLELVLAKQKASHK